MKMAIVDPKTGETLRTEAQWERMHRHIRKGSKGCGQQREWYSPTGKSSAVFYRENQTCKWSKAEVNKAKREKAAKEREKAELLRAQEIAEAAAKAHSEGWLEAVSTMFDAQGVPDFLRGFALDEHTAYQWVSNGFIPSTNRDVWKKNEWQVETFGRSYRYCPVTACVYDPEAAGRLMDGAPKEPDRLPDGRPYIGLPWW